MRVRLTVIGRSGSDTMALVHGRWTGKPVRLRHGPATVTGKPTAGGLEPRPLARHARREGAGGPGPEVRRPPSDRKPEALAEGVAHPMKLRPIAGMVAGLLSLGLAAASAHAAGPADVTVRVEGAAKTLAGGPVRTTTKPVVKDGNASHACTGTSAAGALETATGGDWTATWFDGLGYSVDSVKGESHTFATDEYWTLWI